MTVSKFNRLGKEKSPYLLQHQHNPVHWFPWGDEAFATAVAENKPIFLSIGYSTCYWCHVMEKESFESEEVAAVLNENFINIKIDREERTDIDKVYMDAVISMTGHGGWPLTAILTPDLMPFYGGTYFPREQLMQLLNRIIDVWGSDRKRIQDSARSITQAMHATQQNTRAGLADAPQQPLSREVFGKFFMQQRHSFDAQHGGFGQAPKFPPSAALGLLLRIYHRTGEEHALQMVRVTLERMARGGIYDHLAGGFARYSTDANWLVPHFEKMLYDNALLAKVYLEAAQVTGEEMFASVAKETLDYVIGQMTAENGGFYAAEDAGDVGREGEFYVWDEDELEELLEADEFAQIKKVYGITSLGNFEHNFNILNLQNQFDWSVKAEPLTIAAQQKLLAARNLRRRPHRDEKILVSWNALMISALAKGYEVLGEKRYLDTATACARFIKQTLYRDQRLLRRYCGEEARFVGLLEDYSYLIQALLDLYHCDFDSQWLNWAEELQAILDRDFWDQTQGGYFYSGPESVDVLVRKKDYADGALPSSNAVSALNLLRLYSLVNNSAHLQRYQQLSQLMTSAIVQFPAAYSSALIAADFALDSPLQVVLAGDLQSDFLCSVLASLRANFSPNKVVVAGTPVALTDTTAPVLLRGKLTADGKDCVYICRNQTCSEPLTNLAAVEQQLGLVNTYEL